MRPWPVLVAALACTPEVSPSDDDPTTPTDDTDVDPGDTDTDEPPLVDTDLGPGCSAALPDGWCPSGTSCQGGHCLMDLDPGAPVGDLPDRWAALVTDAIAQDLGAGAHPEPWATVDADVRADLAAASTAFQAAWAMTRGVARLRNGHTYARAAALCDHDPGLTMRESDAGACVVESDGELVVYKVDPGSRWRPGDVLLAIGGRDAALLVEDRLAQPRCTVQAPSDAGRRAEAVASLLLRLGQGGKVRVRGVDGVERTFRVPNTPGRLRCDGRVPQGGSDPVVAQVRRTALEGGVTLIQLDGLGDFSAPAPTPQPNLDALRAALTDLAPGAPVIVDVRGLQGGFSEIVDQLAAWSLPDQSLLRRCTIRTGATTVEGPRDTRTAADPTLALDGPLAVLVDELVYGGPENLPSALRDRALLVGRPSFGSYGLTWALGDRDLTISVEGRLCVDAEGESLEGLPPPVDLDVTPTAADAAAGIDTVVEAARRALLDGG